MKKKNKNKKHRAKRKYNKRPFLQMERIYQIHEINELFINQEVKIIGRIAEANETFFVIYSHKPNVPSAIKIKCTYSMQSIPPINEIVSVKGIILQNDNLFIDCKEIKIISLEEALQNGFLISQHNQLSTKTITDQRKSFFTKENLDKLQAYSHDEIMATLKQNANEEGFKLVLNRSCKNAIRIKLLCYLHSGHGKQDSLNTNCPFYITISRIVDPNNNQNLIWHVDYFNIEHNHYNSSLQFAHKTISEEHQRYIRSLYLAGINYGKIAIFTKINFNIDLSREQLRFICQPTKQERIKEKISEIRMPSSITLITSDG